MTADIVSHDGPDTGDKLRRYASNIIMVLLVVALAWSFWSNAYWMQLCAGLAFFIFGMQCLEEGLRDLAGDKLEATLAHSTSTPLRSLGIGIIGTTVLQSSTLVSLMTIAFISTGLIGLAAGIAIIFGANLGATTGIWLLALAGQNFSLSPLALPLVIFGVLASFCGPQARAAGRILLGIAFIFLGIDEIRGGFSTVTQNLDLTQYQIGGVLGHLLFAAVGLVLTLVLQSTHATLMLTLTALSLGQVDLTQAADIAIGANVGSSVTTGLAGALGGNRSGQRLALAHVLFNVVTAVLALLLIQPLVWLAQVGAGLIGFGGNDLLMLAVFHTLFNTMGILVFWPLRGQLADWLTRVLPDVPEPAVLIGELETPASSAVPVERTRARYLNRQALRSFDTAASAVVHELQHLGRLSIEVICHALYLPLEELDKISHDTTLLRAPPEQQYLDAETLYQRHIKGVYSDLLAFMGRVETPDEEDERAFWVACQMVALHLVETVKDVKHLQKNLGHYLRGPDTPARDAYIELRLHLICLLHDVRELGRSGPQAPGWQAGLAEIDRKQEAFETRFRSHVFAAVREDRLDGLQLSSLINDLGYAGRIARGLRGLLQIRADEDSTLLFHNIDLALPTPDTAPV
ncbi:Na/Pi cotransporter family protein [Pseudochelatococcus contaminans]|uniref:Phosphate:Na+ symporter n=1 Tax=Pseudochelatococcus contaminans TaxID=1538103 RepID=A0A7W5Z2Y1_9HYPH|nr:Na/Pi symporter [Pseudochelatococcus contaminans]MBB3809141.1 phosphate:Na+ symporter [Pseudochelatococcus contaminans]